MDDVVSIIWLTVSKKAIKQNNYNSGTDWLYFRLIACTTLFQLFIVIGLLCK